VGSAGKDTRKSGLAYRHIMVFVAVGMYIQRAHGYGKCAHRLQKEQRKKSHYSHHLSFSSRRSTCLLCICGVNGDLRNDVLDQDADSCSLKFTFTVSVSDEVRASHTAVRYASFVLYEPTVAADFHTKLWLY
jgi:hypothetical protein